MKALFLLGPTASGKTAVALALAERFPVEVISVDSAQVYRDMDIGTAKPSRDERARVRHHLIDILDPTEAYSAGRFRDDAIRLVGEITQRGHLPVLAGGTMLYFSALSKGLADLPPAQPALRAQLEAEAAREGWPSMHEQLARIDPSTAGRLKPTDAQRIQRALEVHAVTGEPISLHQSRTTSPLAREFVVAALIPAERPRLHAALDARFNGMLDAGLLGEVRKLRERGDLNDEHPAIRAVGYRQLWTHLGGGYPLETAVARAQAATRQLAKRQMTWLRSMPDIRVFDPYDAQSFVGIRDALFAANCLF